MKSEKTKPTPEQIEKAGTALNELMLRGETSTGLTYEQAFEILENADPAKMVDLSQEYFKFEKPGTFFFVVEGIVEAEMQDKKIEVVKLRDKDGAAFINGDKVLVSSCKRLEQLPAGVRITYEGDVKNAKGTYKAITVKAFPVTV